MTATLADTKSCDHCGASFEPDRCTQRFCSVRCRGRYNDQRDWERTKTDPVFAAEYRAKNRKRVAAYHARSAPARKRQAAERKLAKAAAGLPTKRSWYMGWCSECGQPWVDHQPARVVCSRRCLNRRSEARYKALKRAARIEDVWRSKVYERDHWHCQLCHKPVRRDKPVPHPLAPTLDHIVPLARGGEHSYANVQLAHFICNCIKSDGPSQLRLCA